MIRWPAALAVALAMTIGHPAPAAQETTPGKAPARARKPGAGKKPRAAPVERMQAVLRKLNLTPAQQTQVQAVLRKTQAEVKTIRASSAPPAQRRPRIKAVMVSTRKQIQAILTPEQQKRLKELMRQARQARQARQKPGA